MYIDCHTHCRDEEWKEKETIEHALKVAKDSGLSAIFDMPNVPNPVTTRKRVLERIALAETANSEVFFGIYIGLTSDPKQIQDAVKTYREFFPKPGDKVGVIGLKMFAGESVGNLSVSNPQDQLRVYERLGELSYEGVLAVHCEKESEMNSELWDSSKPITHCESRPELSEVSSVVDQLNFAIHHKYAGHLHIVHVSTLESVNLVNYAREELKISCGVTPHHLLLDNKFMNSSYGALYKVNPPLRDKETQEGLLACFLQGQIDILESDHAPHTFKDKTEKYMSGIPGLASWPDFIDILRGRGASQELIDNVAYDKVNKIFKTHIPRLKFPSKSHVQDYCFNAYEGVK